jgi:hypothetical protein
LTFITEIGNSSEQWESPDVMVAADSSHNWWVAHNGQWLGHYPASLFDEIDTGGCYVTWYGEVFDDSETDWTPTNMGNGRFAADGWTNASYHRNMYYWDSSGVGQWFDSGIAEAVAPVDSSCYTTAALNAGTNPFNNSSNWFYLGGPGGDQAGCN